MRYKLMVTIVLMLTLSACGLPATPVVIYITATPVPIVVADLPTPDTITEPTAATTPLFGPTVEITFRPLPTLTRTPAPPALPTWTPSFTPEFTDTPRPPVPTVDVKKCAAALQPNGFTTLYQANKALQASLGCPQSGATSVSSATLSFENGTMIWASALADQPRRVIYVLFNTGAYLRLDDTWVDGVDSVDTGESAPAGKTAPIRGFGKAWKLNPTARAGLGWATGGEAGTSAQIQRFERGELIFVAATNQTYILVDGKWRADATRF